MQQQKPVYREGREMRKRDLGSSFGETAASIRMTGGGSLICQQGVAFIGAIQNFDGGDSKI